MGFRFRRSFTLAPGLRLNLSGSGLSCSVGPRGASMTFGQRGIAANLGIPGTGLSFRQPLVSGTSQPARSVSLPQTVDKRLIVRIEDDGAVRFVDADTGKAASDYLVAEAKRQAPDALRQLVATSVDKINAGLTAVATLHRFTPAPAAPHYDKKAFELPEPVEPKPQAVGFFAGVFTNRRAEAAAEDAAALEEYERQNREWVQCRTAHLAREERHRQRVEEAVQTDLAAMEEVLQENFADVAWPRETKVSFEVRSGGALCLLDVDLPEIEDMPASEATVSGRGFEVKLAPLSEARSRKLYAQHVHAVAFRLIGEVFATLPRCEKAVISGYSQRRSPATGQIEDEYLLSVAVDRYQWRSIDFSALDAIDPVAALGRFECHRTMTRGGIFSAIEPIRIG